MQEGRFSYFVRKIVKKQRSAFWCRPTAPLREAPSYQTRTKYKRTDEILPQVVAELSMAPWGHHRLIINKCKSPDAYL